MPWLTKARAALEIGTYGELRFVAHSGSWVGFKAQLLRFPEQRFSVIGYDWEWNVRLTRRDP
jgi:hypothetical protein